MGFAVLSAASSCTRPSFFSPSGTDLSALSAAIPSLISSGASVNFLVCGSMHQSRHRHVPLMVLKSTKRRNSGSLPPRHSHGETLSGAMVGDERGTGTSWDLVHIGRGAPVQVRNTRPIHHEAVLLRRFDAQCLGERGELVALLLHAGAELGRPEDRHDLTGISKPFGGSSAIFWKSAAMLSRNLSAMSRGPNTPPMLSNVSAG